MKGFFEEFKQFIARGNVLDLAVGIIIGSAFTSIVNSLVNDIIMPPIGMLLGNVDFSDLYINLTDTDYDSLAAAKEAGLPRSTTCVHQRRDHIPHRRPSRVSPDQTG